VGAQGRARGGEEGLRPQACGRGAWGSPRWTAP